MAKMIGQLGNLNIYEQQALKEALEGRGYSGSQSIASRLDQLANLAEKKIKETTETYKLAAEGGGEAVLSRMMGGAGGDSKMQKLQQLQDMLAELKKQKAATGR
jgi:CHASE3 domain sensor protein